MDLFVKNTQEWLNDNFDGMTGYTAIPENGNTGWTTIYALLHAFQITLGITNTANNFGPSTKAALDSFVSNHGPICEMSQQEEQALQTAAQNATGDEKIALEQLIDQYNKLHGIIQGALLCKGYSIGASGPTGHFYSGTANAVRRLKQDAGLSDNSSTVTYHIFKALFSMDYFYSYDTSERTQKIILMQRYLNANYESYIDGLTPCDGIYTRGTSKALIFGIQCEEGMPTSTANGNFGDSTKRCLPNIPYNGGYMRNGQLCGVIYDIWQDYTNAQIDKFKILANMAMYFNGIGSGILSNVIDSDDVEEFQTKYAINTNGIIDYTTWCSLLVSCGDVNRPAIACDTATLITSSNINLLVNNNYDYIGRYLSGTANGVSKALTTSEIQLLFSNGIRIFPIFQEGGTSVSHFTQSNASIDAQKAATAANNLDIQFGAIIYFAVDFDATDAQITNNILPYFSKLRSDFLTLCGGRYRIGVYGTRNVCKRVCSAGLACSSFVSDMSTGYSGNLGFDIPDNWAFDQFANLTYSSSGSSLEVDKDGFSGRYKGISQEYSGVTGCNISGGTIGSAVRILINRGGSSVPVYSDKVVHYPEGDPDGISYETGGSIIGYIKVDDIYIRYPVSSPSSDNVHKVLFNDGEDVKIGFITEQYIFPASYLDPYSHAACDAQILPNHESFIFFHYNENTGSYDVNSMSNQQIFTMEKQLPYFDSLGNYQGMLEEGDKIVVPGNASFPYYPDLNDVYPWAVKASKVIYRDDQTSTQEDFGYYVSLGLEYSISKSDRAWM